jgi:hypothetical protein
MNIGNLQQESSIDAGNYGIFSTLHDREST